MQLADLLADLPDARISGPADIPISGIAYDSRAVRPGSLFVAIRGFHADGHRYIPQAIERGAAAIVAETPGDAPIPWICVANTRAALAPIAAAFYGHPGRAMRVVGITGTDGKTTTTILTSALLDGIGRTNGFMGTVDFKVAGRRWANDTRQSTPEAPDVQALLRDMADAGCDYAVIEATSHALSARWNRLGGCAFDIAVLTNVTREHLDYHGSVEQYRRDKARLFEMLGEDEGRTTSGNDEGRKTKDESGALSDKFAESSTNAPSSFVRRPSSDGPLSKSRKIAIVNADDPNRQMFLDAAPQRAERLTYAIANPADVRAHDIVATRDGLRFAVATPWGAETLRLKLTGSFNVANALAALTIGLAEGAPLAACARALEAAPGVRGRMERIDAGQPFTVLVDYAHTPGAFEKLMQIVRPITDGRLIAVFGSAGERDREKRAIQGEIAARFCDLLVLTDEDPRLEDRDAIIAEIAAGAERGGKREGAGYLRIPDRAAAIDEACARARPGDIVLLLGKGHEGSIFYGSSSLPWDEAGAARAALRKIGYGETFTEL